MPNLRKPNATHLIEGTLRKDRHSQPAALEPMDTAPPRHLPAEAGEAWNELCAAGMGVFARSDAQTVEITAALLTRVRAGETTASSVALLFKMLKSLGLSPDGRRSVDRLPTPKAENPFAKFRNDAA